MQARDVMTREVLTVGPGTSAKHAAGLMARRGYAALPVVDDAGRLVGIVAEGDVLAGRLTSDTRLHAWRPPSAGAPPMQVGGVMTTALRCVEATADVADLARVLVTDHLRSVPVLDRGRLVGIVSRRDLLRVLVRPDAALADELLALLEGYTGEPGAVEVGVVDGVATVRRRRGTADPSAAVEQQAFAELARSVGGVVDVRFDVPADVPAGARADAPADAPVGSGARP